jgi:hypothetical protein
VSRVMGAVAGRRRARTPARPSRNEISATVQIGEDAISVRRKFQGEAMRHPRVLRAVLVSTAILFAISCGGGDDGVTSSSGPSCQAPVAGICEATRDHSGCCSSHGGIAGYDSSNCRVICNDGQYSPSCCW